MRKVVPGVLGALLLVTGCGGDDGPDVPAEVQAFTDAREALLAEPSGGYTWTVRIKAFQKPLVRETVCWDAGTRPPAIEALQTAEAYGAHRGDASLVDVDVPADLALALLGVEEAVLGKAPLEPEDLAPAIVGVSDGRLTTLTVNGAAVARRLEEDEVPVNADIRSHADLATVEVEFGDKGSC